MTIHGVKRPSTSLLILETLAIRLPSTHSCKAHWAHVTKDSWTTHLDLKARRMVRLINMGRLHIHHSRRASASTRARFTRRHQSLQNRRILSTNRDRDQGQRQNSGTFDSQMKRSDLKILDVMVHRLHKYRKAFWNRIWQSQKDRDTKRISNHQIHNSSYIQFSQWIRTSISALSRTMGSMIRAFHFAVPTDLTIDKVWIWRTMQNAQTGR